MRKRKILWICLLVMIIMVVFCVRSERSRIVIQLDEKGNLSAIVSHKHNLDRIIPIYNSEEGIYYFFLPSYAGNQSKRIYLEGDLSTEEPLYINEDEIYSVTTSDTCYPMVFLSSANLPTLFLETDEQSMERVHSDKNEEVSGGITVYSSLGEREYGGRFDKLSGRGNSTWARNKKSYNLSLHEEEPLCGLESGKKWVLSSLVFEDTKLNNMIALDLARELGMKYTSEAAWVDLYIDGDYRGIYLLLESITCDSGRVEIQKSPNAFLIEKEIPERCTGDKPFFSTQNGKTFLVQYPKMVDSEQVDLIAERIDHIESSIYSGTPDFDNEIDLDSFAAHYLVDEITNQIDCELSSMYFYQKTQEGKLYAGPIWDYDNSLGAYYPDYERSVLEHESMDKEEYKGDYLHWYIPLMQNEQFRDRVRDKYVMCQPYLSDLLENRIDNWADDIRSAVHMDSVRWKNLEQETRYGDFEQNVRFIKFYLGNRLNFLNKQWGIEGKIYDNIEIEDESHTVSFDHNGVLLKECCVKDGECLLTIPDKCMHSTWVFAGNEQEFTTYAPVLCDMKITCVCDWNGTEACAVINLLKQQESVKEYWDIVNNDLLSYCIWLPEDSRVWSYLEGKPTELMWVVDNGLKCEWKCRGEESLIVSTTFGSVDYGRDDSGFTYLYIQGDDINYLESAKEQDADIVFIVINRELGAIEDVRSFTMN